MDTVSWQFQRLSRTVPRRIPPMLYLQELFCHLPSAMGWFFLGCGLAFAIPVIRQSGIAVFTGAAWVILLCPLFGLGFILIQIPSGLHRLRLLRHCLPAVGTLVAMEKTCRCDSGPLFYHMTFRFTPDTGKPQEIVFFSDRPKPAWLIFYHQANGVSPKTKAVVGAISNIAKVMPKGIKQSIDNTLQVYQATEPPAEKDLQETVLYLPANPARTMLPLSFKDQIFVDDRGNLQGTTSQCIMATVFPVLTFVGYYLLNHLINRR